LHERFWQARLECPGGGTYRWNEEFQTMESSVFGHPEKPKLPELTLPILRDLRRLGLGMTFENSGLRARGDWQRTAPANNGKAP